MYYLHVSHQLESPLPVAFLEPCRTLLLSNDLGAQRAISLFLVNLLVKKNVCDEVVVRMGMLVPVLEMFQSADPTVQCNSSACVAMLASSEAGREAILSADGLIPLLVLAKSYDPRVQQNAVWALSNLTQSETSVRVLCEEGGIPVLALLLQSADSEVQFNSCSVLSNIAVFHEHHSRMLAIGDQFLLKSLLTLTSSSVQKNSSQACRCLRILSGNVLIQSQLMGLDCVGSLRTLLFSPGLSLVESAIALLSVLAAHPTNNETLVDDGLLEVIGQLLLVHRCSDDIIRDSTDVITNLCTTSRGQQGLKESECVKGLLHILVSSLTTEEAFVCVTLCLHKLTSWDLLRSHVAARMSSELVERLVTFSGQTENQELSYNSASIISKLPMNDHVIRLLQPHFPAIAEYLLMFLENQDVRFQHLGLATLCNLKDGGFAAGAGLEEQLVRVHLQTERTRNLLLLFQQPPSSPEPFLP